MSRGHSYPTYKDDIREMLHPDLREQFVPLPAGYEELIPEQIEAIFKVDGSVLKELLETLSKISKL